MAPTMELQGLEVANARSMKRADVRRMEQADPRRNEFIRRRSTYSGVRAR